MPFSFAPHTRRLWAALAAVAVAVVSVTGVLLALRSPEPPRVVAVVNEDTGAVGDRVVAELTKSENLESGNLESGGFEWEVSDAAPQVTAEHVAVVTIPADFTDRIAALGGPNPQQAEVTVERGPASGDEQVSELTAAVAQVTSAAGIRDLLSGVASARSQLQQATLPAQILTSATAAAEKQAQQMLGGVDEILPLLQTANDGANQLVDVAAKVSGMVDGAREPAAEASARLSELGVTLGDVTTGAAEVQSGLTAAANTLRTVGVDPATADTLDAAARDLTALTTQLTELSTLLGTDVGAGTDLGAALGSGFRQVEDMSAQLSSAGSQLQSGIGPIAAQAPDLLATATDQVLAGVTQLKTVSATLSTQLGEGIGAIPLQGGVAAVSSSLASPVSVVEAGAPAASPVLTANTLMIVFAATTIGLAVALASVLPRRSVRHSEA